MVQTVRRLCIFAHFNARPVVEDFILYHLKRLREVADDLVFVSNSPLTDDATAALSPICSQVIQRPNEGFDFSAWREVLLSSDLSPYDEIILTNSGIIGPLCDLEPILREMGATDCDFWGLTRYFEIREHLQSYFLCFKRRIVAAPEFSEYWSAVTPESGKGSVIQKYEIGMTHHFASRGFRWAAYMKQPAFSGMSRFIFQRRGTFIPKWRIIDRNRANPTIYAAYEMVLAGFPYVKASLLWGPPRYRRPQDVEKIRRIDELAYDWSMVDRILRSMA